MAENKRRRILNSWKEIAGYLRVNVSMAQRWERRDKLPIYRVRNSQKSFVIAYTDEIDRWIKRDTKGSMNSVLHFLLEHRIGLSAIIIFAVPCVVLLILYLLGGRPIF